jgi:chemosensory pili system protein ChpA (sensor histidine kinase/response regulator)
VLDAEDALQSMLDGLRHPVAGRVDTQSPSALPRPDVDTLISRLRDVKAQAAAGELGADAAVTAADGHAYATPPLASDAAQGDGVAWPLPEGASVEPAGAAPVQGTSRPVGQLIPLVPLPTLVGATGLPTLLRGKDDARHSDPPRSMGDGDAIAPHDAAPTPESARENGLRRALRALEDQQVSRDALELLLQDMGVQAIESRRASARLRDLAERVEHELAGLRLELVRTTRRSGEWDALEKEEYTAIDVLLMQLDEALADQQEAETRLRRDLAEARAQNELQGDALLQAQRALLNVSMVPLSSLEARLDHAVRSVARRVNKAVVFEMDGAEITLDGRVAEALFNPLMLLVNNALDHGLEEKESERTAAGKSAEGHIVVRGRTNGDSVTIAVADDGRGIDPERVAAVAVSKGLVDAARAAAMTREERLALIWQPGFSTAKQVGAISGRGMGMKSVQDDIAALQGRIDVETETGKGTTFTITLPRSLALMRVQVVREGRHLAAVPIADLASTHALPYNSLVEVPGGRVVRLGARTVVVYAAQLGAGPAGDGANNQGILLEVNGRGGGIVVDEVLYSQYVPVRPAPAHLRRSCGLIGYALGAGGVILPILDVATLIDRASTVAPLALRPGSDSPPGASPARQHTILVVDDSQTMRRALTQTFGRAGFVVREAVNGREALAALGRERPDVITLDMEMPEMDGLETLAALRLLPGGTSIPVFMITSRQQARHRAAALAAGVTRYFTKPYDDDEVVGAARLAIAGGLAASEVAS